MSLQFLLTFLLALVVTGTVTAQVRICPPGGGTVHQLVVQAQVAQINAAMPNAHVPVTNDTIIVSNVDVLREALLQWSVSGLGGVPSFAIRTAVVSFPAATSSPSTGGFCQDGVFVFRSHSAFDPNTVTFASRPATDMNVVGGNCRFTPDMMPSQDLVSFSTELDVTDALIASLDNFQSIFGVTIAPVFDNATIFLPTTEGINLTITYCSTAPQVSCNGVGQNVTGVCSFNGDCISQDVCQCNSPFDNYNFTGNNCQIFPESVCGVQVELESATFSSSANKTQLCYNIAANNGANFDESCNVNIVIFGVFIPGLSIGCYNVTDLVDNDCWAPFTNGATNGNMAGFIYICGVPAGTMTTSCLTLRGPVQLGFGGGVIRASGFLGTGFTTVSPICPRPSESHLGFAATTSSSKSQREADNAEMTLFF